MKIVYTGSLPSGIVPVDGKQVEFVRGEPIEVPDGFAERLCEQRGWEPDLNSKPAQLAEHQLREARKKVGELLYSEGTGVEMHGTEVPEGETGWLVDLGDDQLHEKLSEAGVTDSQLVSMSDEELLALPGIGPAALEKIRAIIPAPETE